MNNEININRLRSELLNYFGTAMAGPFPMAMMDVAKIENASDEELIQIALDNHFDLDKYSK